MYKRQHYNRPQARQFLHLSFHNNFSSHFPKLAGEKSKKGRRTGKHAERRRGRSAKLTRKIGRLFPADRRYPKRNAHGAKRLFLFRYNFPKQLCYEARRLFLFRYKSQASSVTNQSVYLFSVDKYPEQTSYGTNCAPFSLSLIHISCPSSAC